MSGTETAQCERSDRGSLQTPGQGHTKVRGNNCAALLLDSRVVECEDVLVWSKNSCGLSLVVFEQAAKSFTILNRAVIPALWPGLWKEQHIALALMIALLVVMVHILVEHVPQGVFAEQNHP